MTEFLASFDSLEGFQAVDMDEVRNINGGGSATSGNTQGFTSMMNEVKANNPGLGSLLSSKVNTPVAPSSAVSSSSFTVTSPTPTTSVRG